MINYEATLPIFVTKIDKKLHRYDQIASGCVFKC